VSAALSEDHKTLTFAVLNPSDGEQRLKLSINGAKLSPQGHLWRMAPASVEATNAVGQKPGVEVEEKDVTSSQDTVSVPPFSVNIYSFAVQ
jgi:alpha-N-arabinofuranosidase